MTDLSGSAPGQPKEAEGFPLAATLQQLPAVQRAPVTDPASLRLMGAPLCVCRWQLAPSSSSCLWHPLPSRKTYLADDSTHQHLI